MESIKNNDQISWKIHPALDDPGKTLGAILVILAFSGIVFWNFSSIFWMAFSCCILFFSLARYFLPTRYLLTPLKIESSTLGFSRKCLLSHFQRAEKVKGGIFLSPFSLPNRLEHYRGVFLMCKKNQSEVFEFVKRHIGEKEILS
ncbi:hypothetical protein JW926_16765 [Candidatus Sumerlaeota bacterium]|nr:hypothetical protein [Candidatus Sumerlaeota bacterium]